MQVSYDKVQPCVPPPMVYRVTFEITEAEAVELRMTKKWADDFRCGFTSVAMWQPARPVLADFFLYLANALKS